MGGGRGEEEREGGERRKFLRARSARRSIREGDEGAGGGGKGAGGGRGLPPGLPPVHPLLYQFNLFALITRQRKAWHPLARGKVYL